MKKIKSKSLLISFALMGMFFSTVIFAEQEHGTKQNIIIEKDNSQVKIEQEVKILINKNGVFINGIPAKDFETSGIKVHIKNEAEHIGDEDEDEHQCKKPCCRYGDFRKHSKKMRDHNRIYPPKPYLGVFSIPNPKGDGVIIKKIIHESAAEDALLEKGDVILKIDDTSIKNQDQMRDIITSKKIGDLVHIIFLRDGKQKITTAKLKEWRPDHVGGDVNFDDFDMSDILSEKMRRKLREVFHDNENHIMEMEEKPKLGMEVETLEFGKGLKITEIQEGSPAEKSSLKVGDIITKVSGQEIVGPRELKRALYPQKDESEQIHIEIIRGNETKQIQLSIPKKKIKISL